LLDGSDAHEEHEAEEHRQRKSKGEYLDLHRRSTPRLAIAAKNAINPTP
jgi:hypothetical protein